MLLILTVGTGVMGIANYKNPVFLLKVYLKNGEVYCNNELILKDSINESLSHKFLEFSDSLLTNGIVNNLRNNYYLLVIDTLELSTNVSSFIEEFTEDQMNRYAYFTSNKLNDTINNLIHLFPDDYKDGIRKFVLSKFNKLDLIVVGDKTIEINHKPVTRDRLLGHIDILISNRNNLVYVQAKRESKFIEALQVYRLCDDRFQKYRNSKSIEQFGIGFDTLKYYLSEDKEGQCHEFRKKHRPKIILDLTDDYSKDSVFVKY
ncbi:hypothetical protein [Carboxylicivirga sp. RSCT41]|uniref:hypothetical protein n=1 Tax=Carboxylicivirga agarovorans TaxID=3417570 RepID=UPI003D32E17C